MIEGEDLLSIANQNGACLAFTIHFAAKNPATPGVKSSGHSIGEELVVDRIGGNRPILADFLCQLP